MCFFFWLQNNVFLIPKTHVLFIFFNGKIRYIFVLSHEFVVYVAFMLSIHIKWNNI